MFGKILKTAAITAVFLVIGLLLLRIGMLNRYPAAAEGVFRTGSGQTVGTSALTFTPPVPYDDPQESKFFSHQPIWDPETKLFFVTVRYNRSLADILQAEFAYTGDIADLPLSAVLFVDGAAFSPVAEVRCKAYGLYYYRRYAFENVDLADCEAVDLTLRFGEIPDLAEEPFSTLPLYLAGQPTKPYILTKADAKNCP